MTATHPTPAETTADVLIIGGGPAGGLTAALLAEAGLRTVLVEAHAHLPARVCGAYLCPAGVALLEHLQILHRLAPRTRQIEGMILVAPDSRRLITRFPADGSIPPRGLALRRPEFDEALLHLAAERGAIVKRGHRATEFHHGPDGWRVQLDDGTRLRSPLLIGADGRKSRVARILGLEQSPPQSRVAIHVDVVSLAPNPPFGEMHVFPDGTYIGLNPIGSALLNVSAVCDPDALRDTSPARFLEDHIQQSEHLRHRIARFAPDVRIGCTFPAAHAVRDVATAHGALVGDASGFIDPLTGEGIYQALWTARALSTELIAARQAGRSTATALRRYAAFRRRQHRGKRAACRLFQSIIRRPQWSNNVLNLLAARPRVGDAFIGMIGNIYSPIQAFWKMVRPV